MANHKSAIKRISVTKKKNLRNRMIISAVKTAIKRFDSALETGNAETIDAAFRKATSVVDKAVTKGILHRNAANRKKAQLAKKLAAK
ncbi:MAG: 30S ribosomal protein S20 [Clostridia bacterium]|nr:30S ribosomal protein S20 [Clostridia bacterium]